jgi:hypothetical protein
MPRQVLTTTIEWAQLTAYVIGVSWHPPVHSQGPRLNFRLLWHTLGQIQYGYVLHTE